MDRHIRDQQKVPVRIHKLRSIFLPFSYYDTAGNRQRTVKPCRAQHPSIAFRIQLRVLIPHLDLGILLDLKGRGITVGSRDLKTIVFKLFSHVQCNDTVIIAGHIVPSSRPDLPLLPFVKSLITIFVQHGCQIRRCMERCRTLFDKFC